MSKSTNSDGSERRIVAPVGYAEALEAAARTMAQPPPYFAFGDERQFAKHILQMVVIHNYIAVVAGSPLAALAAMEPVAAKALALVQKMYGLSLDDMRAITMTPEQVLTRGIISSN